MDAIAAQNQPGEALGGTSSSSADHQTMVEKMCRDLMRQQGGAHVEHVDFDILAVFLMQEFGADQHITDILAMVEATFTQVTPRTMLQHQIHMASSEVRKTVNAYQENTALDKPFCLRFPTLSDVLNRAQALEPQCKVLPRNKLVIIVDSAGKCVGVGVPPLQQVATSVHTSFQDTATKAIEKYVAEFKLATNESELHFSNEAAPEHPTTPHPLDNVTKGMNRAPKASTKAIDTSSRSFQLYGFGLSSVESKGTADQKIPFDSRGVKVDQLEGVDNSWRDRAPPYLPEPLSKPSKNSQLNASCLLKNSLVYYSCLSLWINKAFLPEASNIAERCIRYLVDEGSDHLKKDLMFEQNQIVSSLTVSVNTQVHTHRDMKNSFLFDSALFFGNHTGGDFILPALGVAYPGDPGFSFHGPLRIIWHGVGKFHFKEGTNDPRRYSVALWSRASSFSAIARRSAHDNGNKEISNPLYWLPIYPVYDMQKVEEVWAIEKKRIRRAKQNSKRNKKRRLPGSFKAHGRQTKQVARECSHPEEMFEAYSHGRETEHATQEGSGPNPEEPRKKKEADLTRGTLRAELHSLLSAAVGRPVKFPMQTGPSEILAKRYPALKIVQCQGSQLSLESLEVGVEKMEHFHRKQWLADIKAGHFKIASKES